MVANQPCLLLLILMMIELSTDEVYCGLPLAWLVYTCLRTLCTCFTHIPTFPKVLDCTENLSVWTIGYDDALVVDDKCLVYALFLKVYQT